MGWPRALGGFYSFVVLSSIGASLIVLAFARRLSTKVLLPAALAVLALHPLLDVSPLPTFARAVLYEPVRSGSLGSFQPQFRTSLHLWTWMTAWRAKLDFADLGRIAGDADQAIDEPVGIFCALSVIR